MQNIVAIVGRPNVGKSTLFNRLTRTRTAIIHESSGVTRDRHYAKAEWQGVTFTLIDTGGYVENTAEVFEKEIRKQVLLAIEEASVILFMADVTTGMTKEDEIIAGLLRKSEKKLFLAVNKVDNNNRISYAGEFYKVGIGETHCISSTNGFGTGELLDNLVLNFEKKPAQKISGIPRIAIVGRPNVGKSSLINLLLEEERCIVTPVAGTTRAVTDTHYRKFGQEFILVDTAGLRRKSNVSDGVEFYSTVRTIRAIEESDVCLFLIDATEGFTDQDTRIFKIIETNLKGVVIAVNKWDMIEKTAKTTKEYQVHIQGKTAPFHDVPVVFTSVVKKQRILNALEFAAAVFESCNRRISEERLNNVMLAIIKKYPPPTVKGKLTKIYNVVQHPSYPQIFTFYCNLEQYAKESYSRFLENKMRENFDFTGVPLRLLFKRKP